MPEGLEGYIIDTEQRPRDAGIDRIKFLYFGEIENSIEANYDEVTVRGRSEPHPFYMDTSPDTYSFEIKLVASVDQDDSGDYGQPYLNYLFLKSFQYPDYGPGGQGPVRPPRQVIIQIGKWFRKKGIIKSPSFTFHAPYDSEGYPYSIDCKFTFRVINKEPLDYRLVRSGLVNVKGKG